jgi:hypothetical protein
VLREAGDPWNGEVAAANVEVPRHRGPEGVYGQHRPFLVCARFCRRSPAPEWCTRTPSPAAMSRPSVPTRAIEGHPAVPKADERVVADHEVVQDGNVEEPAGSHGLCGQVQIVG